MTSLYVWFLLSTCSVANTIIHDVITSRRETLPSDSDTLIDNYVTPTQRPAVDLAGIMHISPSFTETTKIVNKKIGTRCMSLCDGYEFFSGVGVYKLFQERASWGEAYFRCKEDGAQLAVINSITESTVLASMFNRFVPLTTELWSNYLYVGFQDKFVRSTFVTVDGKYLHETGFSQWAPNEPNTSANNRCGGIDRLGLLKHVPCLQPLHFVCEKTVDSF